MNARFKVSKAVAGDQGVNFRLCIYAIVDNGFMDATVGAVVYRTLFLHKTVENNPDKELFL